MLLGDSKTASGGWPVFLDAHGQTATDETWFHDNAGIGGSTVASYAAQIATVLAGMPAASNAGAVRVLLNWGANDFASLPAEATWEANYLTIIDAAVAKWPSALVYLMRPWSQGRNAEADTLATRIGHLIAARPGVVFAGPDERIWLKGADDGATMTSDGMHYSEAGKVEAAAQWAQVLW